MRAPLQRRRVRGATLPPRDPGPAMVRRCGHPRGRAYAGHLAQPCRPGRVLRPLICLERSTFRSSPGDPGEDRVQGKIGCEEPRWAASARLAATWRDRPAGTPHRSNPDVDSRQERFRGGSRYPGRRGPGPEGPPSFGPRQRVASEGGSRSRSRHGAYDSGSWSDFGEDRWRSSDAVRVRVRDIMTEEPEFATPSTSLTDVARRMRELDVGTFRWSTTRRTATCAGW
jgi:hypothetical protein